MDLHEQGMSSRTFVIAAIVCVLLQAGLAPQISIAGGRVNFMIILVCLSVFSGDPTRAVVCGFCSGLFYDLSAAVPVGVMSLLLTVGSFALGSGNGLVAEIDVIEMLARDIMLGRHVEYVGELGAERPTEDGPPVPEPERLPQHAQYGGLARPILSRYHGNELPEPNLEIVHGTEPGDFNPLDAERQGCRRRTRRSWRHNRP